MAVYGGHSRGQVLVYLPASQVTVKLVALLTVPFGAVLLVAVIGPGVAPWAPPA